MKLFRALLAVLCLNCFAGQILAVPFVPDEPVMAFSEIRPGMRGYGKTVFRGREIATFPVEVVSLLERASRPSRVILIRALGPEIEAAGGLAAGMSGSPVYIDGKLIGAFGFGWDFSRHRTGLVTSIEDMISLFDYPDAVPPMAGNPAPVSPESQKPDVLDRRIQELAQQVGIIPPRPVPPLGILTASGISQRAINNLSRKLASLVIDGNGKRMPESGDLSRPLRPGDSVTAMLAWGDVSLDASGTLTAVSRDGRFLAFGHSFKNGGAVAYPLAESWVHAVIPGLESPFKLTSPGPIAGLVTQDRPEGLGGRFGRWGPAISVTVTLEDRDQGTTEQRRFRMIPDVNMAAQILPDLLSGAADQMLGRSGAGSARYELSIQGGALQRPWRFEDRVWASDDVLGSAMIPLSNLISLLIQNRFVSLMPLELKLFFSVSSAAERLSVERVELDRREVSPGDTVTATVTLRPWRSEAIQRQFQLKVPADASLRPVPCGSPGRRSPE